MRIFFKIALEIFRCPECALFWKPHLAYPIYSWFLLNQVINDLHLRGNVDVRLQSGVPENGKLNEPRRAAKRNCAY